jgi:hypothetical protein
MTHLALTALFLAIAPAAAEKGVELPGGRVIDTVDFERHVVALFGRSGCASGSCHGSFQGKGGFQLSLFGYDPAKDHDALVRQAFGRRLNQAEPEKSLLLQKAIGGVEHGGLTRFSKDSWQYRLLHAWIAQGAKRSPGSGEVKEVRVTPPELPLKGVGSGGRIQVQATFQDGTMEDISALCEFRSNDDAVVEVDSNGGVKGLRPGDTAVIVSYRGQVLPVRVMVPVTLPEGKSYPQVPTVNYIDVEVFAKLKRLNIFPSELSSDAEFLRRVTIDTIGTLPTPAEVRAFLADTDSKKREKVIDRLLAHPMHAALWATKFCDITGNNTDGLENPPQRKPFLSQMWHDWLRNRLEKNVPYDQIVRGILTATSLEGKTPEEYVKQVNDYEEAQNKGQKTNYAERETLDLFWRKQARVTIEEWGEKTAVAFLGVRLECAQCHKHPFDRWTQADYRSYANIFSPVVTTGASPQSAKVFKEAQAERQQRTQQAMAAAKKMGKQVPPGLPVGPLREVFLGARGKPLTHPETRAPLPMKALGGPEIAYKVGQDPRAALMDWMASKENPFFAASFVNRVWGHYLGVGIVHPVDDFSLANPPSNPKLLAALAEDFIASKFDIRAIEKRILMSRTYQLSSKPNETNRLDRNNYSRSYVRPLMAEVVVDVLNAALGTQETWATSEAPAGSRAIEVGASRVTNANVNHVFRVFGRSPRAATCDCERSSEPALPQKLYLLADPNLLAKLKSGSARITQILKEHADDRAALDELFLTALARPASDSDWKVFQAYKEKKGKGPGARRELFADVMWALINTSEFIFNH